MASRKKRNQRCGTGQTKVKQPQGNMNEDLSREMRRSASKETKSYVHMEIMKWKNGFPMPLQ